MKNKIYLVIAGISLIIASFIFFNKFKKSSKFISPKVGPIVESIYGLGTVQSDNVYTLKLGVTTMIQKLYVQEGDRVRKKQRLLIFDEEGLQSQYAPFEATVTQINYFAGETVFPQSPILTLMDLEHRYISVTLDQDGAIKVRPKQKAYLSFENLEVTRIEGTVRAIFPKQGQMIAHIESPQLPPEILPGMTADVSILIREKKNAILIPLKVVNQGQVKLRKNNSTVLTSVKLGIIDAEWGEVLSPPLTEADLIESLSE